jgi:hypothetical protein
MEVLWQRMIFADALAFLEDLFPGLPAPNGCSSIGPGNSRDTRRTRAEPGMLCSFRGENDCSGQGRSSARPGRPWRAAEARQALGGSVFSDPDGDGWFEQEVTTRLGWVTDKVASKGAGA